MASRSVAPRPAAQIERLARLQSFGGWLLLGGLGIVVAAGLTLYLLAGAPVALRSLQIGGAGAVPLALLFFLLAGAILLLVGLGLYLLVPGLDASLARRGFDAPPTILACLIAVFILGNLLSLPAVLSVPLERAAQGRLPVPPQTLAIAMLTTQLAVMTVLIWRIVRPAVLTWEDMGLTTAALDRRLLQGAFGGILILVLAGLIALAMHALGVEQTQARMFDGIRGVSQLQFLSFWLIAAVIAPICEECFFRGYVFTALRGRYGRWVAYPGSALLFAAIHFNLPALVPILVMALGLAFLYDRSKSVVPGIVAHGLNNSVALTLLYAGVSASA